MVRFIIVFSLSFFLSFQVYAAPKIIKAVTSPSAIKKKPTGSVKPLIKKPDLMIQEFTLTPSTVQNGDFCSYTLVIKNIGGYSSIRKMLVTFNSSPQQGRSEGYRIRDEGSHARMRRGWWYDNR